MANKTVYPYGTEGKLPSSIGIINDLETGGADKALAAEQGKILDGKITLLGGMTIVSQELDIDNYPVRQYAIDANGDWVKNIADTYRHTIIPVSEGQSIQVTANSSLRAPLAWLTSIADPVLNADAPLVSGTALFYTNIGETNEYLVPAGAKAMYVFLGTTPAFASIPAKIVRMNMRGAERQGGDITISPGFELGAYGPDGAFSANAYDKKYWRTKFIKCGGVKQFSLTKASGVKCRIAYYDKAGNFIVSQTVETGVTDVLVHIDYATDMAEFLTILVGTTFTVAQAVDIAKPVVSLTGIFVKDYDSFAPVPESGYLRLVIPVSVSDADTADDNTATVQDTPSVMYDYGLIAFPDSYSMDGEATRLIIYCHGAGVNYNSDISQFPSTDIQPEYWLSEGYAVMDIEGNPFNNTDEHFYIPQAVQSYIAAYDWVVKTFNIRKDGILLGGRSMGGGMCFEIMQSRIPVIAACPVVPCCNELWIWEWMNASRRQFVAEKMGFTGTAPTWTSNRPMSNAEWNYLQANFDKLVKYVPFWRGIDSLPDKTTLFGVGNIGPYDSNPDETALYETLHYKTNHPTKMFIAEDDEVLNNDRNAVLMYRMMLNAAQVCELRRFPTGGHHYELDSANVLATFENSFGVTLTDVPVTYIEMLAFWRRYEQGL